MQLGTNASAHLTLPLTRTLQLSIMHSLPSKHYKHSTQPQHPQPRII